MTDLAVVKASPFGSVTAGEIVRYDITVMNNGPLDEPGAVATDTLPDTFAVVSATPSQGSCAYAGRFITCELENFLMRD